MTPGFDSLWYWLADYYALATCVLLAVGLALLGLRQPARRLTVSWSALGGLLALLIFGLVPFWPRTSLVATDPPTRQAPPTAGTVPIPGPPEVATSRLAGPRAGLPDMPRPLAAEGGPPREVQNVTSSAPSGAGNPVWPAPSIPVFSAILGRTFLAGACLMLAWLSLGSWRAAVLRRRS